MVILIIKKENDAGGTDEADGDDISLGKKPLCLRPVHNLICCPQRLFIRMKPDYKIYIWQGYNQIKGHISRMKPDYKIYSKDITRIKGIYQG